VQHSDCCFDDSLGHKLSSVAPTGLEWVSLVQAHELIRLYVRLANIAIMSDSPGLSRDRQLVAVRLVQRLPASVHDYVVYVWSRTDLSAWLPCTVWFTFVQSCNLPLLIDVLWFQDVGTLFLQLAIVADWMKQTTTYLVACLLGTMASDRASYAPEFMHT
jgi:hypothetical protein